LLLTSTWAELSCTESIKTEEDNIDHQAVSAAIITTASRDAAPMAIAEATPAPVAAAAPPTAENQTTTPKKTT
jgi:hypothetical protein